MLGRRKREFKVVMGLSPHSPGISLYKLKKLVIVLIILLADVQSFIRLQIELFDWTPALIKDNLIPLIAKVCPPKKSLSILLADAKGVAGLGKAGGDGTGGSDKAGQQVPPEVYNALTYAGSAFLLTLSVPLILYGLNKLLNKIEDCFGCGPSSKKKKIYDRQMQLQKQQQQQQQNQQQQMQSEKQPHPLSIASSVNNNSNSNGNNNFINNITNNNSNSSNSNNLISLSQQQQQQPSMVVVPMESNSKMSPFDTDRFQRQSPMNQGFQQPFIISSPHL